MKLAVVLTGLVRCVVNGGAPIAQLAEAADLKSAQCGFESPWGHTILARRIQCVFECDGLFVCLGRRAYLYLMRIMGSLGRGESTVYKEGTVATTAPSGWVDE